MTQNDAVVALSKTLGDKAQICERPIPPDLIPIFADCGAELYSVSPYAENRDFLIVVLYLPSTDGKRPSMISQEHVKKGKLSV